MRQHKSVGKSPCAYDLFVSLRAQVTGIFATNRTDRVFAAGGRRARAPTAQRRQPVYSLCAKYIDRRARRAAAAVKGRRSMGSCHKTCIYRNATAAPRSRRRTTYLGIVGAWGACSRTAHTHTHTHAASATRVSKSPLAKRRRH